MTDDLNPTHVARHVHRSAAETRAAVKLDIRHQYRCYYCGIYWCNACSAQHFGGKRPLLGAS